MAKQDSIKRQFLIVEFLRNKPANFQQINDFLLDKEREIEYNLTISHRTFQRDCDEIATLWGIEIGYNKRENVYEITDESEDSHLDRLMEAFDTVALLQQSKTVGNYIYLEKRKSKGTEFFNGIVHAIQNQLVVTFQLNSYWKPASQRRCVPVAIKESQNRYYLIGYDLDKKAFRNYGLDRLTNFTVTRQKKQAPAANIEKMYRYAFGIECYNEPVKIILKFDNGQKEYVKSLPFHASQKIVNETEDTFIVELFMHPTNDFVMEIMRHGTICEVLEPQSLRENVREQVNELYEKYKS
ncbi:helix-turn-helix transcriptional regulator [Avrilella dinanensis]|uniref:Uncharacterized protein n=1 Tax=Avrilella dinanensis TaxID=2008672 RepID=A0A2M9R2Q8_9FLAO|nr:WYL domain-containing protein [Avrilella dinanensis]PJR03146.1 hypothetical protein CDL10_00515 [Avrilella dinanensis]